MYDTLDPAHDLLAALDDTRAATARDGLTGRERLSRAALAADSRRDLAGLAVSPYRRDGSRLADAVHIARAIRASATPEQAAAGRAAHARQAAHTLAWQLRAVVPEILADVPGLLTHAPVGRPVGGTPAAPLLALGSPFAPSGPTLDVPQGWDPPPMGVLDPAEKTSYTIVKSTLGAVATPWHLGVYGLNVSGQVLAWGDDARAQVEALFMAGADAALETGLIADLAGAAMPAADMDAAEAAAGSAGYGPADTVVVNPADWPAVRRGWAGVPADLLPVNRVITTHATAGTVLVFPLAGVCLLVGDYEWSAVVEPSIVGEAVACTRAGLVAPRAAGVVQAVTITAA